MVYGNDVDLDEYFSSGKFITNKKKNIHEMATAMPNDYSSFSACQQCSKRQHTPNRIGKNNIGLSSSLMIKYNVCLD